MCKSDTLCLAPHAAATHLRAVVDDASNADACRRGGAAGCAVLAAARDAMPDVDSLELAVHHRCYNHRNVLQHLRALGTWRRLRHLRVRWVGADGMASCVDE